MDSSSTRMSGAAGGYQCSDDNDNDDEHDYDGHDDDDHKVW